MSSEIQATSSISTFFSDATSMTMGVVCKGASLVKNCCQAVFAGATSTVKSVINFTASQYAAHPKMAKVGLAAIAMTTAYMGRGYLTAGTKLISTIPFSKGLNYLPFVKR